MKLVQSLAWIIGSALFIPGASYKIFHKSWTSPNEGPAYIRKIVQTGPQREALKTAYLAQLIGLSSNKPTLSKFFDIALAESRLRTSPVIQEATVKLSESDTLYIDYTVRQPVAALADFENMAIDSLSVPFPLSPFFTPKNLPEIYLGIDKMSYHQPLKSPQAELALSLLKVVQPLPMTLQRIDVSKAFSPRLAEREIICIVEDGGYRRFLRLSAKHYPQGIGNYLQIREKLPPKPQVIDLRLTKLGYLSSITNK
ncbi:MAG: hypothetical protein JSR58_04690 [Verrucomicrobia bacterium]|nr:hypothetical protein [Verrucomicrobiota bacterium]